MKIFRLLTLMLVALIPPLLAFAGSQTQSAGFLKSTSPSTKLRVKASSTKKSALTAADEKAIEAIAKPLFSSVVKGEYAQGLQRLQKVYSLDKAQRSYLAERMLQLEQRVGRASSFERLSRRFLPGSAKVVRVYYMTLHPLKPAVWALDFYRSPGLNVPAKPNGKDDKKTVVTTGDKQAKWILTSLRIETEAAFALVEGSQIWHKNY